MRLAKQSSHLVAALLCLSQSSRARPAVRHPVDRRRRRRRPLAAALGARHAAVGRRVAAAAGRVARAAQRVAARVTAHVALCRRVAWADGRHRERARTAADSAEGGGRGAPRVARRPAHCTARGRRRCRSSSAAAAASGGPSPASPMHVALKRREGRSADLLPSALPPSRESSPFNVHASRWRSLTARQPRARRPSPRGTPRRRRPTAHLAAALSASRPPRGSRASATSVDRRRRHPVAPRSPSCSPPPPPPPPRRWTPTRRPALRLPSRSRHSRRRCRPPRRRPSSSDASPNAFLPSLMEEDFAPRVARLSSRRLASPPPLHRRRDRRRRAVAGDSRRATRRVSE